MFIYSDTHHAVMYFKRIQKCIRKKHINKNGKKSLCRRCINKKQYYQYLLNISKYKSFLS